MTTRWVTIAVIPTGDPETLPVPPVELVATLPSLHDSFKIGSNVETAANTLRDSVAGAGVVVGDVIGPDRLGFATVVKVVTGGGTRVNTPWAAGKQHLPGHR